MIVEIKSVTLVEESIAKFPDAITIRAKKHVKELGEMAQKGISTMILFVVQRPDAFFFKPKYEVDPNFCKELYNSIELFVGLADKEWKKENAERASIFASVAADYSIIYQTVCRGKKK